MKRLAAVIALACLFASPLSAQTYFYSGTIGKTPVFAELNRDGEHLIGSYLYLKYGKSIELSGKIDAHGAFHLDETSFDTTKKSGNFDGRDVNGVWSGTWTNAAGGAPQSFALTESHDTLAGFSGDFQCAEHHTDKQYGYKYSRSARVTFTKGVLTRLELSQESKGSDGDEQSCSIGLSDLKRIPGNSGVILRGKNDAPGQDVEHCTIRIVGNANFIYVSPGDLNEQNNDCKGSNDVMFCSPRANFGDVLIDKTGVCKPAD